MAAVSSKGGASSGVIDVRLDDFDKPRLFQPCPHLGPAFGVDAAVPLAALPPVREIYPRLARIAARLRQAVLMLPQQLGQLGQG